MTRTTPFVPAAAALLLALAGCAADSPQGEGRSAAGTTATAGQAPVDDEHDDADTAFAQMMIVHHEGAVEMADLAVQEASSEEVRVLAEDISAAQGPEIELMRSWLDAWGEEPAEGGAHGMDHGDMDMSGMEMDGLTQEEAMAELSGVTGAAFDERFLELMVAHHQGAVQMAQAQLEDGENPQAVELAQTIIADQQAEIAHMEELLSSP